MIDLAVGAAHAAHRGSRRECRAVREVEALVEGVALGLSCRDRGQVATLDRQILGMRQLGPGAGHQVGPCPTQHLTESVIDLQPSPVEADERHAHTA